MHLGHQRVMAEVVDDNRISSDIYATVVTFSPHPQAYFSGISKPLLTPIEEKAQQLSDIGIRQLVTLPFNASLAALSPQEFVEDILVQGLQAQRISVGSDFRFGKGRSGDAQGLKEIAAKFDVPVVLVPLKAEKGDRISSSRIRNALQNGELSEATRLLGRPYTLSGTVVKGKQLGRTIGFPTANLQVSSEKFLPRTGVYSVWVYQGDRAQQQETLSGDVTNQALSQPRVSKGVMNIGHRPTVDGQALSIEAHLLDWEGDLYGQTITVSLESFIRSEQKFDSLEALKSQIVKDCETAKEVLGNRPSAPYISV